jgi:hypothetical protein
MQKKEAESLNQEARNQNQETMTGNSNLSKLYCHYIGKSRNAKLDIFTPDIT